MKYCVSFFKEETRSFKVHKKVLNLNLSYQFIFNFLSENVDNRHNWSLSSMLSVKIKYLLQILTIRTRTWLKDF